MTSIAINVALFFGCVIIFLTELYSIGMTATNEIAKRNLKIAKDKLKGEGDCCLTHKNDC